MANKKEKVRDLIDELDHKYGGIHKTEANKNREVFIVVNRKELDIEKWLIHLSAFMEDLKNDKIDSIMITTGERTW